MKILILTGKFGMGHWAASLSLRQQLLQNSPEASVEVEDFLTYAMPKTSEALYKAFNLMVTHGSLLFNLYYGLTSLGRSDARPPFEELLLSRLEELLWDRRPDLVIATHPLCAQTVSRWKERTVCGLELPLVTCITDVSSHPEWINRNTDCYLVPNREVKESLTAKGVKPSSVRVTGIPVREEFHRLPSHKWHSPLSGFREEKDPLGYRRELLVMGGGLGLLPSSDSFYEALNRLPHTHTTIITGRNRRLFRRLWGRWENIQVVGYTDRVWDYMRKADMIVTKPGGITLFESIFAQVPIFAWKPALCQERNNARWLVSEGIGWTARQKDCAEEIRNILLDENRLAAAAERMGRLREQYEAQRPNRLTFFPARTAEAAI